MRFLVVEPSGDMVEEELESDGVECAADETDGWERAFIEVEDDVFDEFEGEDVHCG